MDVRAAGRPQGSSPFDVAPVSTQATTQDILEAIRDPGKEDSGFLLPKIQIRVRKR
jgi:hypothetical protein